jgi:hypothetical protein
MELNGRELRDDRKGVFEWSGRLRLRTCTEQSQSQCRHAHQFDPGPKNELHHVACP